MSNLKQVVANALEIPVDEISDETSMATVRNWDSLRHINLILTLEVEFGVKFSTSEIMLIDSLEAARELLYQKGVNLQIS